MFLFAFASLTPAVLLGVACIWGGIWPALAVVWITAFVFFMDRAVAPLTPDKVHSSTNALLWVFGVVHFTLWGIGIWAVGANPRLDTADKLPLLIGIGLYFGQISNSAAHELIHTAARAPRRLGIAIYGSLLFAHHASAHMRVHHVWAATLNDPSTAQLGQGFWRFLLRAWIDGFVAGKRAEDHLRRGRDRPFWTHPYAAYATLSVGAILLSLLISGGAGLIALLVVSIYAQVQLYLSDYVQHYGLERRTLANGKPEPIGPEHSWNAPHWYSSAMMLNAPRHSDHHINPARSFPALTLKRGQMPILPYSLPVMAVAALIPFFWRRLMDKRAMRWRQDGRG